MSFVYKSVLQVTSSNLRIQHTYLLLQAIVCRLPYSVLCLLATLQVWQVHTSRTPAITHSIVTVTAKYTPKAALPDKSQSSFYFYWLVEVSKSSGFISQPFKDVLQSRPPLVSRHPITFATPQQHTCMAASLLPPHLFSARRTLPFTHTTLQRPSSTKILLNVTRPTIQASC
jgi:hypothetical protein